MGQKFQCQECDYQATWKNNLVRHKKAVHMGQTFPCPECDFKTTLKGNLARHKTTVHKQLCTK